MRLDLSAAALHIGAEPGDRADETIDGVSPPLPSLLQSTRTGR